MMSTDQRYLGFLGHYLTGLQATPMPPSQVRSQVWLQGDGEQASPGSAFQLPDASAGGHLLSDSMIGHGELYQLASSVDAGRFAAAPSALAGQLSHAPVGATYGGGMQPILEGAGLSRSTVAVGDGGGGGEEGDGSGGEGGEGGGGFVDNLVDFSDPDFRWMSGEPVRSDIGGAPHGAVFTGGLRFTSQGRMYVEPDGSGSSALQHNWIMRIDATKGGMSEVSFKLKSGHNIAVKYYDAEGNLLYSETVPASAAGAPVTFTPSAGKQISYFTVGGAPLQNFTIDDINYTVNGSSSLVDFTNATFKYADGTTAVHNYFDLKSVFLGTLEISSTNTMFQFPRNSASNGSDANHLGLYGWAATTFTLHKQNVFTVKFDAEFRGAYNEIVFYDADNNVIGSTIRQATAGHGNMDLGARQWESVEFNSGGAAIAYFIVKAGRPQVDFGHQGIAIDNIAYPQSIVPGARSLMAMDDNEAVVDDVAALIAQGLTQEPAPTEHDQSIASRQEESALGGTELSMADKPTPLTVDTVVIGDIDPAGDSINVLDLALGDLLNQGAPELFVSATGVDHQLVLAHLSQDGAGESDQALHDRAATPGDATHQVYEHSGLQSELLALGMANQMV